MYFRKNHVQIRKSPYSQNAGNRSCGPKPKDGSWAMGVSCDSQCAPIQCSWGLWPFMEGWEAARLFFFLSLPHFPTFLFSFSYFFFFFFISPSFSLLSFFFMLISFLLLSPMFYFICLLFLVIFFLLFCLLFKLSLCGGGKGKTKQAHTQTQIEQEWSKNKASSCFSIEMYC